MADRPKTAVEKRAFLIVATWCRENGYKMVLMKNGKK